MPTKKTVEESEGKRSERASERESEHSRERASTPFLYALLCISINVIFFPAFQDSQNTLIKASGTEERKEKNIENSFSFYQEKSERTHTPKHTYLEPLRIVSGNFLKEEWKKDAHTLTHDNRKINVVQKKSLRPRYLWSWHTYYEEALISIMAIYHTRTLAHICIHVCCAQ